MTEEVRQALRICPPGLRQAIDRLPDAGAMEELALSEGLFVDIGGASTEVVRFAHGQLVSAVSCPVGSLKLYRDWVKKILPNQQAVESMKKAIRQATRGVVEGPVRQGGPEAGQTGVPPAGGHQPGLCGPAGAGERPAVLLP